MKTLALVLCGLFAAGCLAQDMSKVFGNEQRASATLDLDAIDLIEPAILENKWAPQVSNTELANAIVDMLTMCGKQDALTTNESARERAERDQLADDEYNASSDRLQPGTKAIAQFRVEISTGGKAGSSSKSGGIGLGNISVSGSIESGTAEAYVTVRFRDLVKGTRVPLVVTGRGRASGSNVSSLDLSRYAWGRSLNFGFSSSDSQDAPTRRGYLAVGRAMEDLFRQLQPLFARQEGR